jgi:hypothetical protein
MGNLSFHLKKFDPPLILKAMEAANIDVDIASERFLGHESYDWKPVPGKADSVDIYVSTVAKSIKCSRRYPYDRTAFSIKKKLRPVMHLTHRFNEVIYNDNARYAITYCDEKAKKTALISTGGTIYWDYPISALRPSEMKSCATVRAAIVATGLEPMIAPFFVDDLHKDRGEGRAAVVT